MGLKYLVVGTGRDGTVSLTRLINDIFRSNGIPGEAVHEYLARDCYNNYCLFQETGERAHLDRLQELIRNCPHAAIVGNGYAPVLDLFREAFPNVALIHLKRHDRDAVIRSHAKNSKLFPETYLYYGAITGIMRRVAAFHEGEMSREEWDALTLSQKFGWFYDYTHQAVEFAAPQFLRHDVIHTENLSDQSTLCRLAAFITGRQVLAPEPVHLNRHAYLTVDDFTDSARPLAQWLFGNLSAQAAARDAVYLSEYFTNKYIALIGYQISGFIREVAPAFEASRDEIHDSLCHFERLVRQRLKEVEMLKADLAGKTV